MLTYNSKLTEMNKDFKDVMSKRTDKELIKIVTVDRNGYQPLALEAAEEEIKKRNIDSQKIEQLSNELTAKKQEKEKVTSKEVSSMTRFIHLLVDTIVWILIVVILTFSLNVKDDAQLLLGYMLFFISYIGYYAFMETKYQKTVGKFLTKTSVVNRDGTKPAFSNILRRTLFRLIPFDRISFLFTRNGFHDKLSNTRIIKDE